jgi:hypothetical protein
MADRYSTARTAQEIALDDAIHEGVRATNEEIFYEALGQQAPDRDSSRFLEEQSMVEGFDGDPLPDHEMAYTALHGYGENNFDRSVAMQEQLELAAENKKLREANAALHQGWQQYVAEPEREQQMHQYREHTRNELAKYDMFHAGADDSGLNRFIAERDALIQQNQALQADRVNRSLDRAHEAYGKDFDDAFRDITSMRNDSPLAREIVRNIWTSENPGAAVMQHHENSLVQSLGRTPPPFFAGDRVPLERQARGSARRGGDVEERAGFGDREIERDVMDSVWD